VKVVFDTNVIVAGIVAEGLCREIVEIHLPEQEPVLCRELWDELTGKLRAKFGLEPADLPLLALYHGAVTWVQPRKLKPPVCRDPDDDRVLACALAGGVRWIVTGDADLLVLEKYQGIEILNPRKFLERI
jgi:uncharacterized protein